MKPELEDTYDPEALDQALGELVRSAQAARDSFTVGDDAIGRAHFDQVIHYLSVGVVQISLLRKTKYC